MELRKAFEPGGILDFGVRQRARLAALEDPDLAELFNWEWIASAEPGEVEPPLVT